jgi:hypothetical protein
MAPQFRQYERRQKAKEMQRFREPAFLTRSVRAVKGGAGALFLRNLGSESQYPSCDNQFEIPIHWWRLSPAARLPCWIFRAQILP